MRVGILSDSTNDIPREICEKYDIIFYNFNN